jgi:hypothetical protein
MQIIRLVWAPTSTSTLCSMITLTTRPSSESLIQRQWTFQCVQKTCPTTGAPEFSQLRRLPRLPTSYTFRASLLTSLSQAAQGKHFSPTYLFGLATRPCHRADLQHDCALSSTRNLLAMHFRRCHFAGPYIHSLMDTSLPRSSLSICLSILAWRAILPRMAVCSL